MLMPVPLDVVTLRPEDAGVVVVTVEEDRGCVDMVPLLLPAVKPGEAFLTDPPVL